MYPPPRTQTSDDIDPNPSQHSLHPYATTTVSPIQQRPYFASEAQISASNAAEGMVYHWPAQPPPRTGDARELESLRAQLRQYQQEQQRQQKRDHDITYFEDEMSPIEASSNPSPVPFSLTIPGDPMAGASDFVRKLYRMLDETAIQSLVSWSPIPDSFVIKDINEFSRTVLPRIFKHSNFASFVRQLNKYDFHKIKNVDDNEMGPQSWTFRHPEFQAGRPERLEFIKRKPTIQRKPAQGDNPHGSSGSAGGTSSGSFSSNSVAGSSSSQSYTSNVAHPYLLNSTSGSRGGRGYGNSKRPHSESPGPSRAEMTAEIQRLKDESEDLRVRMRNLERNYEAVIRDMSGFQAGMSQQDGVMKALIRYFLGEESGE
ncbi:hypothetical protein M413DRAFT_446777 [Hebeloma cylindrosporum]|uniref:HSF-type DNA-binding domain-containing protein n=1 Tax=Hebeloma cylindrosporum TaxID=76867 RepID=A0A0C2XQE7_HEBCY|nr:hypothetical protein M413DRAFT_446777 [Hebeloma cylindrosporum h7]